MAAFIGRQAQCNAFHFDFVGYSGGASDDSFLTRTPRVAQQSTNYIWGVSALRPTKIPMCVWTQRFCQRRLKIKEEVAQ